MKLITALIPTILILFGCTHRQSHVQYMPCQMVIPVNNACQAHVDVCVKDLRVPELEVKEGETEEAEAATEPPSNEIELTSCLKEALECELAARGFCICSGKACVHVEIEKFETEFQRCYLNVSGNSCLVIKVKVTDSWGSSHFSQTIYGRGVIDNAYIESEENKTRALQCAFNNAIEQLMYNYNFIHAILKINRL